ncbi:MaoC family dehydratase [Streptomyces sp. ID05-04B]|uniref:MaoC family dehydratase n=1 Tax=Streptomyces sp. ID05-04B TaxID=3028661 RepID=UPI0029C4F7F3|nr:MaoC family dehydratase [Streptomyces sp. ID05-04B]MDX5569435.1 MaoC family dehydratase [Streptomyces sp. ID05-04B]
MNGGGETADAAYPRYRTDSRLSRAESLRRTNPGATTVLSDTDFATPIEDRYFEDYVPGAVYVYGSITMARLDILRFADEFDPQSIHNDPQAARQGPFSGLIASGRHTCSVTMRMYVDHYVGKVACLASPGIDELRRVRPVRPGDRLSLRATVQEARVSRSKPDRGLVTTGIEVLDQHGQTVLTMSAMNLLLRRPDMSRPG